MDIPAVVRDRFDEHKVYATTDSRMARRADSRFYAREQRKANRVGRRRHQTEALAHNLSEAQARILEGEYDPALVSPDLVRNVERAFLRRLRAQAAIKHPWNVDKETGGVLDELATIQARHAFVDGMLREMGLTRLRESDKVAA